MNQKLPAISLLFCLLAGCTAVPDAEISTVVPTRTPMVEATAVTTAAPKQTSLPFQPSPTAVTPTEISPHPTPDAETVTPTIQFGQPFGLGRGVIQDAAFLPGGEQVAVGWANGLSLFNVADAAEQWYVPFGFPLIATTVHPQGTAVAAALTDGSIVVVDATTGQAQTFAGARPNAYWGDVAWSPDGRTIAFQFIGPRRGDPIYLLAVADGSVTEVPGSTIDEGTRPYLVWSPDSQKITLASLNNGCGRIVNVATGDTVFPLTYEDGCYEPFAIAWTPDGSSLALNFSNELHVLDAITFEVIAQWIGSPLIYGPIQTGDPMAFSADGRILCSKGGFGYYNDFYPFKVWDVATGALMGQQGEDGAVLELERENPHRMAVNCDSNTITSLFRDGRLTQWSPQPSVQTEVEETVSVVPAIAPLHGFVWSADGRKIAAFNRYFSLAVWDVASGSLEANFDIFGSPPTLSADGRLIALLDRDNGEIAIYDVETQQLLNRLPEATSLPRDAFAPDSSLLAYGADNLVRLADPLTGAVTAVLDGHPVNAALTRAIWSPDSSALVTAGSEGETGELILWERTAAGDYQETFRSQTVRAGYDCCVSLALFNPSANLVALETAPRAEADQFKIAVFDRETGSVIRWLTEYKLAAWVSDETLLTTEAQFDTRFTLWDVHTGTQMTEQARDMGAYAYAPNGLFYALQSSSGSSIGREVDIYSWQSDRLIARLPVGNDILQMSWSPDGRYLAALAVDGAMRVWPVVTTDN